MARRKADVWYVGAMTDWNARTLEMELDFLPEGNYKVEIYRDGANADKFATDYIKYEIDLQADRRLEIRMAPGGGWVAKISPCGY